MRWSDELFKKAREELAWLFHDMHSVKIIVYFLAIVGIFSLILVLFTFAYTGSCCPLDLLDYNNISYSYAGSPNLALIFANDYNIGINGASNSIANLTVYGESNITMYTKGNIDTAPYGGNVVREKENKFIIHTSPGEVTNVYIDKTQDEVFNYNMLFKYNATSANITTSEDGGAECFKLIKKGDVYKINSTFRGPALKKFSIKNYANNTYPIFIRTRNSTTGNDPEPCDYRMLNYTGRVRIYTNGDLEMNVPTSEISPLARGR